MTELELLRSLNTELAKQFEEAVQCSSTIPRHALVLYRDFANTISSIIATDNSLEVESPTLFGLIEELWSNSLISRPFKDDLHRLRILGNNGAHESRTQNAEANAANPNGSPTPLQDDVVEARGLAMSCAESLWLIRHPGQSVPRYSQSSISGKERGEMLLAAVTSSEALPKVEAALMLVEEERRLSSGPGIFIKEKALAHQNSLRYQAIALFEGAIHISADFDRAIQRMECLIGKKGDERKIAIAKHADPSYVFMCSEILSDGNNTEQEKELGRAYLQIAADNNHSVAQAILGDELASEGRIEEALKYTKAAMVKQEPYSYFSMFLILTSKFNPDKNLEEALGYLERGIELGCLYCLTQKGVLLFDGQGVKTDKVKGEQLLNKAAKAGSVWARNFIDVHVNDLQGQILNKLQLAGHMFNMHIQSSLAQTKQNVSPSGKLSRNALCYCGSGKKYKKCCLILESQMKKTPH